MAALNEQEPILTAIDGLSPLAAVGPALAGALVVPPPIPALVTIQPGQLAVGTTHLSLRFRLFRASSIAQPKGQTTTSYPGLAPPFQCSPVHLAEAGLSAAARARRPADTLVGIEKEAVARWLIARLRHGCAPNG